ncbi:MAG: EAL domain-containing protein [Proteobacteria bacterium]|nr:MAG: EAL domain-containing protein [Pseudomonadota bacterium]
MDWRSFAARSNSRFTAVNGELFFQNFRLAEICITCFAIETEEQLSSLIEMGCTYGQGYLFGEAVPAEAAVAAEKFSALRQSA